MVLLINQHTVPIFIDVVNAFAESGKKTVLFTGHIEKGGRPLSPAVQRITSISYDRKNTVRRFFSWVVFTMHYSLYLLTCQKPDVILVTTNPPLAPIVTAFICSLRKLPFQILLYDLYPDALFQAGLVEDKSPVFQIWQRINRWVFAKASTIFTLSESMKLAGARYVDDTGKFKVIFNWADTSYVHPIPKGENEFIKRHKLNNQFVVLYSGNMGLTHDLESLILAADILRSVPNLKFVLIGDGGKRKFLTKLAIEKELGNVLFLPYQDVDIFPLAMAAADIGVVTLGLGAEGISVPSKTYVNLAAGACVLSIAPKNSELNRLIQETQAGVVCEPGHPEEVANNIRLLMEDTYLLNHHKSKALGAAQLFTPRNAHQYVSQAGFNN